MLFIEYPKCSTCQKAKKWLEELRKDTKVYPLELIPYILEQRKETVHFVSRQILIPC